MYWEGTSAAKATMEAGEEDGEPARKEVTTGPLVALGDPWGLVRVPGAGTVPWD